MPLAVVSTFPECQVPEKKLEGVIQTEKLISEGQKKSDPVPDLE